MSSSPRPAASAFIEATYEQLAQLGDSGLCCSPIELYSAEELASLPEDILRLSSGCGHPVEDAEIVEGMTVVDIGSGAGTDAILAARRTGSRGKVIGVDPSASMRERATRSVADLDVGWVEFRDGTAENIPVPDSAADLVISNCVLSLSTDPSRAWRQIARVLRPGGRICVSDVVGGAATETLDAKTRCETGVEWPEYRQMLADLGFTAIRPVRVRAARYRDGSTARSVTIRATIRATEEQGPVAVDLIHGGADDTDARRLGDSLVEAFGPRISVRLLAAADPENADVIALLLDEAAPSAAITCAIDGRGVAVRAEDLRAHLRDLLA
jgi:ubiquinone/menaquinone biosynthesis C-methylase UbiE